MSSKAVCLVMLYPNMRLFFKQMEHVYGTPERFFGTPDTWIIEWYKKCVFVPITVDFVSETCMKMCSFLFHLGHDLPFTGTKIRFLGHRYNSRRHNMVRLINIGTIGTVSHTFWRLTFCFVKSMILIILEYLD